MNYRFTLTSTDAYSLTSENLVLNEDPQGFQDGFTSLLRRDLEFHGVFFQLSADDLTLGFTGSARTLFKEKFDEFGFDAIITLTIERRDTVDSAYVQVYTGKAVMDELVFDPDFATVTFDENNALIDIINNKDLEVPASATTTLNGTTISPALSEEQITMQGKEIQRATRLKFAEVSGQTEQCLITFDADRTYSPALLESKEDTIIYDDGTSGYDQAGYIEDGSNKIFGGAIQSKQGGNFKITGLTPPIPLFTVTASVNYMGARVIGSATGFLTIKLVVEQYFPATDTTTYTYTSMGTITIDATPDGGTASTSITSTVPSLTDTDQVGGYIRYRLAFEESALFADASNTYQVELDTLIFNIEPITVVDANTINANNFFDVLNHNLAYITDKNSLLESSILGTGGTLENFYETNGFKIRGISRPIVGSFRKRIKSLKSIFNLGYNLELDPYTSDESIRIEKMDYFYADTELMSFSEVASGSYSEEIATEFAFNKVELGFERDSADEEEAGNLYDLHSRIQVRTPVAKLQAAYNWISEHLASDILIEILRRKTLDKFPDEKTDYDDELFVLDCFDDGGTKTFAYPDDQALLIDSAILNGDTGGNYRLNLRFVLFNHGDLLNVGIYGKDNTDQYQVVNYRNVQDQNFAIGFSTSASGENEIGDPDVYADIADVPDLDSDIQIQQIGDVFLRPIFINFRVAISESQLTTLLEAHRNQADSGNYGYITLTNPLGETKTGWLVEMRYTEADKIAQFKLIERETESTQIARITDAEETRITDADETRVTG